MNFFELITKLDQYHLQEVCGMFFKNLYITLKVINIYNVERTYK